VAGTPATTLASTPAHLFSPFLLRLSHHASQNEHRAYASRFAGLEEHVDYRVFDFAQMMEVSRRAKETWPDATVYQVRLAAPNYFGNVVRSIKQKKGGAPVECAARKLQRFYKAVTKDADNYAEFYKAYLASPDDAMEKFGASTWKDEGGKKVVAFIGSWCGQTDNTPPEAGAPAVVKKARALIQSVAAEDPPGLALLARLEELRERARTSARGSRARKPERVAERAALADAADRGDEETLVLRAIEKAQLVTSDLIAGRGMLEEEESDDEEGGEEESDDEEGGEEESDDEEGGEWAAEGGRVRRGAARGADAHAKKKGGGGGGGRGGGNGGGGGAKKKKKKNPSAGGGGRGGTSKKPAQAKAKAKPKVKAGGGARGRK